MLQQLGRNDVVEAIAVSLGVAQQPLKQQQSRDQQQPLRSQEVKMTQLLDHWDTSLRGRGQSFASILSIR